MTRTEASKRIHEAVEQLRRVLDTSKEPAAIAHLRAQVELVKKAAG